MQCLLVSDLHYALKQFDWLQRVAGQHDVVVLAGDHLDISSAVPLEAQIVVLLKVLQRMQRLPGAARLLVSSGNHDLNATNAEGEKVAAWMSRVRRLGIPCDGEAIEIDGTLFSVFPWWDGPGTRLEVDSQMEKDASRRSGDWVWVYHSPPDASPTSWSGTRHFGDADLVAWIHRYRPSMVLAGHIHQSPFRKGGSWVDRIGDTWVFNSGRQIGPVPCHVVFDTERRTATWMSLAGTETIDLADPFARPVADLPEVVEEPAGPEVRAAEATHRPQ